VIRSNIIRETASRIDFDPLRVITQFERLVVGPVPTDIGALPLMRYKIVP
jgi:hypothetical protein